MTIDLKFYEEDWQRIAQSWNAFWAGELDRPIVMLEIATGSFGQDFVNWTPYIPAALQNLSIDELLDREQVRLEQMRWYGDAFPKWWLNYGPGIVAGFLGANVHAVPDTVWFSPARQTPIEELALTYDPTNRWWRSVQEVAQRAIARWGSAVCIGQTDLGGNLDILASMVTTEQLLYDVMDYPDAVERQVATITTLWQRYYDELEAVISHAGRGSTNWGPLWAPQRSYMLQSDFSYMLSPAMFERFVLPDLESCCAALDYPFYHLDGKGQIPHVPHLLGIERLRGIQWQPGAGQPLGHHWLPLLKQIRDGKKLCQVYVPPEGALTIVRELGGKGFILAIDPPTLTEAEAEDFLRVLAAEGGFTWTQ